MVVWDMVRQAPIRTKTFAAKLFAPVAWNPRESMLAFAVGHKVVKLFDADASAQAEILSLQGHMNRIKAVCWHPSGDRIATASVDGTVKFWSTTGRRLFSPGAYAISWNPDGSRYASVFKNSVLLCDAKSLQTVRQFDGHADQVFAASWSPDGMSVASASIDREVRVWNAATGTIIWRRKAIDPDCSYGIPLPAVLTWSPDSRHLAFPQANFEIGIVDATNGKPVGSLSGHRYPVRTVAWSPGGSRIVSGGQRGELRVWNSVTGQPVAARNIGAGVNAICWRPDGSRVAGAATDNTVYLWDLNSLPDAPLDRLIGHTNYVHSVSWSFDGERIASADESGTIRIWDARKGQQTLTLSYPRAVPMVAWNPNGKRLACVGFGGSTSVRIWNATFQRSVGPCW
jgi:WD40 repeat protein